MPGWNYAEIWETVASQIPDAPAQLHGDRSYTWREFDQRANGIAQQLLDAGAQEQDKVAQYLYNDPAYMESMFGAWKAGLVPVNTNYRYADDELTYLWDDADAVAVVFHGEFTDTVERVRGRVATVRLWLWVDDGTGTCPAWAVPYATAAAAKPILAPWPRSGDDLVFIYTGGTTGLPKGVK
ncbi:MAG: fatty-acid--CoA ligase, partial [Acidimicrobiales bacterium]|nr:fatty-acid--CoA ligase [Acidimicrobiales bacterium]